MSIRLQSIPITFLITTMTATILVGLLFHIISIIISRQRQGGREEL